MFVRIKYRYSVIAIAVYIRLKVVRKRISVDVYVTMGNIKCFWQKRFIEGDIKRKYTSVRAYVCISFSQRITGEVL